jgi:hypothetical protein
LLGSIPIRKRSTLDPERDRLVSGIYGISSKVGVAMCDDRLSLVRSGDRTIVGNKSKYPPAKPGALFYEPLKAAGGVANAAPDPVGHLKVAHQPHGDICHRRLFSSCGFMMRSRFPWCARDLPKFDLARFYFPFARPICRAHLPDADAILHTRSSCCGASE